MPPYLALLIWFVLLCWLVRFDPAKDPESSLALWVPLIGIFFSATRGPAQWLYQRDVSGVSAADSFLEGDPLNRWVAIILLILNIAILLARPVPWGSFVRQNWVLMLYLVYALVSAFWSDFPFAAFKKWFRDLSTYLMVLIVISDPRPLEALRTLLRRLGYFTIPLSVMLIKYFPYLSRQYDDWTGDVTFSGASTSKNMLGILCLVCGIYFFWDTVVRWPNRKNKRDKRVILVNAGLTYFVWWLLIVCNSATSRMCLLIAYLVILAAHSKTFRRYPRILTVGIPVVFLTYVLLFFGLGMSEMFSAAVGRNSLSGRPEIWRIVLGEQVNPILGAGYESFWLGPRLVRIWASGMGMINEAHNGYLEVYLNLGYAGLFILFLFLSGVYRKISKKLLSFTAAGSLGLAIWTAFVFHNSTEADFRSGLMWFVFVVAALVIPQVNDENESTEIVAADRIGPTERFRSPLPVSRRLSLRRHS